MQSVTDSFLERQWNRSCSYFWQANCSIILSFWGPSFSVCRVGVYFIVHGNHFFQGQTFLADLQPDGRIRWPEANKVFNSPSAWAIYCKRLVNPSKKSGCGWASVKYKGKKLDQFKTTWFRKQSPSVTSSQSETPSASHKESPHQTSQSTPLSSHKSPPIKSPGSRGDRHKVSSSSKSSTSLKSPGSHGDVQNVSSSTGFHSPTINSTAQLAAHPKSTGQKSSGSSSLASSSYWPVEMKRPAKAPSSGRG